jgi:hypothetical protein
MASGSSQPVSLIFEPTIQDEPLRTCPDRLRDAGIEISRIRHWSLTVVPLDLVQKVSHFGGKNR